MRCDWGKFISPLELRRTLCFARMEPRCVEIVTNFEQGVLDFTETC